MTKFKPMGQMSDGKKLEMLAGYSTRERLFDPEVNADLYRMAAKLETASEKIASLRKIIREQGAELVELRAKNKKETKP